MRSQTFSLKIICNFNHKDNFLPFSKCLKKYRNLHLNGYRMKSACVFCECNPMVAVGLLVIVKWDSTFIIICAEKQWLKFEIICRQDLVSYIPYPKSKIDSRVTQWILYNIKFTGSSFWRPYIMLHFTLSE